VIPQREIDEARKFARSIARRPVVRREHLARD
jgi:hypothetical protein